MIILRLADLLDMSKDRVSINVLRRNIKFMPDISKYHWISHMAIDKCTLETEFEYDYSSKIIENVILSIYLNTKQLSTLGNQDNKCTTTMCDDSIINENKLIIMINSDCKQECSTSCNFMCKWMTNKHEYLFKELFTLQKYLERNSNTIFNTQFQVLLKFEDTDTLPSDYMDIIKSNIIKSN
jgi:hypothetical protein